MPLVPGDLAPEWRLLAAVDDTVTELALDSVLSRCSYLVLTTYPLDFTGG